MSIEISNIDELQAMNNNLAADYILVNNIDASATSGWNEGAGFVPVGTVGSPFTGTFDGQGYTITELYINRPSESRIGLFGFVDDVSAILKDVVLEDADVTGNNYVGGLVGYCKYTTLDNCSAVEVSIKGVDCVGGLLGTGSPVFINNCNSTGSVETTGDYAGGIIGWITWDISTVEQSFSTCSVVTGASDCGGFVGYVKGNIEIINCYATGSVNCGTACSGGFVGIAVDDVVFINCYSTGSVSAAGSKGGFAGALGGDNSAVFNDCFWDIETSGLDTSAGGTGKTTTQMYQEATFTDWDFSTPIWYIQEDIGYPALQMFEIILVKGDNLLVSIQVENPQILGVTADLGDVCVNGTRCEKDCNLVNVTNGYHPGTEDSVIKF